MWEYVIVQGGCSDDRNGVTVILSLHFVFSIGENNFVTEPPDITELVFVFVEMFLSHPYMCVNNCANCCLRCQTYK